jgi:hypothetical protein
VAHHRGPQRDASLAVHRDDCLDTLGPVASVDVTTEIFGRLGADPKASERRERFPQVLTEPQPRVAARRERRAVPELRAAEPRPEPRPGSRDAWARRVSVLSPAELCRVALPREAQRTGRQVQP